MRDIFTKGFTEISAREKEEVNGGRSIAPVFLPPIGYTTVRLVANLIAKWF